ncbi:sulfite exporter TauE/SafE family protein [Bifidobacterium callitrichos]|uniref:Probable membrane transporter protein n=2 Tax=Bifidobacterium callitrichos TaxID=762209 RepID=A0A5M9ZDN3_9BIFI|nr:sulfite exporter TauE/SafE family protein [Bifidobacterium callitrichos]
MRCMCGKPMRHECDANTKKEMTMMTVGVMAAVALAAVLYGLDKSLAPGAGILAVATLTAVMPAKEATGITLIMAIVADWSAIWAYRGNVSRRSLIRLFPFVAIGIAAGAGFLFVADNTVTRLTIGVILAVFVSMYFLSLARKRMTKTGRTAHAGRGQAAASDSDDHAGNGKTALSLAKRVVCGALAGFTTMVANAGGPITSIYFLSENLSVIRFLGTTAWFYLIINLVKLPFSIGLGMITWTNFTAMAWTIPLVVVAVLCGRWVARRVSQSMFSMLVYVLSVVAVVRLFL